MANGDDSFEEFWQHYLRQHAQGGTRILHVLGTGLGVLALIAGLIMVNPMIALIGTGIGYLFAWAGHFLVEHNRPAMVSHPTWSFQCDIRMFRLAVTGQLGSELRRAGIA
ncbi:MAG: Mpo1-like protein [Actinomycetota bacterium]